jgi:hypothetical protein
MTSRDVAHGAAVSHQDGQRQGSRIASVAKAEVVYVNTARLPRVGHARADKWLVEHGYTARQVERRGNSLRPISGG